MKADDFSRRSFLSMTALTGGALVLGVKLPFASREAAGRSHGKELMDAWLRIGEDDSITILCGQSEMGQGVHTSMPMLIAEELGVSLDRVQVADAGAGKAYRRPGGFTQITGGSQSVRGMFDPLRKVGARARIMLTRAAASRWGVPAGECEVEDGVVHHRASGRSLPFGRLVAAARTVHVPEDPPLKDPSEWTILGTSPKRLDTLAKVTGQATFGIDVRLPGMVHAAVANVPVFGGKVRRIGALEPGHPGVLGVHEVPGGVAVVAETWAQASRALEDLDIEWTDGGNGGVDSDAIAARLQAAFAEDPANAAAHGEVGAPPAEGATRVLRAEYSVPFLAHATMEPQNCTAHVRGGRCEIWMGTQAQELARDAAAAAAGVPASRVEVHTTFLGGGFGRRFETDLVAQAVTLSRRVGRPVKVLWSREEDMRHDFYRPVARSRFEVQLGADGSITSWENRIASPSILKRVFPLVVKLQGGLDRTSVEGASHLPYDLPAFRCDYVLVDTHVPVGFWRSVGSSQNAFFTECMIDEAAHAARVDPLEYRLRMLPAGSRGRRVLERLAEISGWTTSEYRVEAGGAGGDRRLRAGRFRGVALAESFGTMVGEVAEISLTRDGDIRVHHVDCVADPGRVVHPQGFRDQMESGIVYGLTAALKGAITIEDGRVAEGNFDRYPLLRMGEMPTIRVELLEGGGEMGGAGEPATPPIAPAVANALFAATGKRVRSLPLLPPDLRT